MKGKTQSMMFLAMILVLSAAIVGLAQTSAEAALPRNVEKIIKKNCSVAGCHKGKEPAANLNLEPDRFLASVVDQPSSEMPALKIVDTADPEKSYLLAKVKGSPGIVGGQMPLKREPLALDLIREIEEWLKSLKKNTPAAQVATGTSGSAPPLPLSSSAPALGQESQPPAEPFTKPAFWGTKLVNLPTTKTLSKGELLFRISHRFDPPVSSGWDDFFGLDGPAFILFSFGYGITDTVTVTLGRSKLYQEWDLSADWVVHEQRQKNQFSVTLHAGGSLVTMDDPSAEDWSGRFRFNVLLSLAHQINDRISFLVAPGFCSNTNFWAPDSEGTFSLGIGGRFMVFDDLSLIAEWVPVLAGYKSLADSWGVGVEKKIGGHVFQVFITNSLGMTTSQFLPGGDLLLGDGDFRLGFNIFRSF